MARNSKVMISSRGEISYLLPRSPPAEQTEGRPPVGGLHRGAGQSTTVVRSAAPIPGRICELKFDDIILGGRAHIAVFWTPSYFLDAGSAGLIKFRFQRARIR